MTLVLTVTLILLSIAFLFAIRSALHLRRRLEEDRSIRRSIDTRHGLVWEQLIPFSSQYPWDPANFRFIGSPIDGVQFEDNRVILLEFKTGKSQLSARQRHIRNAVTAGNVEFHIIRI